MLLLLAACQAERQAPTVTVEELLNDVRLGQRIDVEQAPTTPFEGLLERYDRDRDQRISPLELATRDFQRFDRNRDGLVTLGDFPGDSGELPSRVAEAMDRDLARRFARRLLGREWQESFRTLDVDGDRRLSRVEIENKSGPPEAGHRDPFAALLATVDSWADDQLDWLEADSLLGD